jgi:hypothetical protein
VRKGIPPPVFTKSVNNVSISHTEGTKKIRKLICIKFRRMQDVVYVKC